MKFRQPDRKVPRVGSLSLSGDRPADAVKSTGMYGGLNAPGHCFRIGKNVVLPHTEYEPSTPPKTPEIALVSQPVSLYLLLPKGREFVPPGRKSPSVPKVSINEDGNLGSSEH